MNIQDCFKIGYIQKPHGLKGEVTIAVDSEVPFDFSMVTSMFVEINNQLVPHSIETFSATGSRAIVKFEDIDSQEAALRISKKSLYLPKSTRPKSGRGEFYDDEVVGFEVVDETHGRLGVVSAVSMAGMNKLLAVSGDAGEVLIPLNGPFITAVNKSKKKISVDLPEGFLEM